MRPNAALLRSGPERLKLTAERLATTMVKRGYGVWAHDHWYSLGLREKLTCPQEAVRVGFIHYNTIEEVDGFVEGSLRLLRNTRSARLESHTYPARCLT